MKMCFKHQEVSKYYVKPVFCFGNKSAMLFTFNDMMELN